MPESIVIQAAQVGPRAVVFKANADLSEFDPDKLQSWTLDYTPCDTLSLIEAGEKITTPRNSAAFAAAYTLAYAETHITALHKPDGSWLDKPGRELLAQAVPFPILTAFVSRTDTSAGVTGDEYESLKKKTPSAGGESETSTSVKG